MRLFAVLLLISLLSVATATTLEAETCDAGRMKVDVNYANADVILGGLFDLRKAGDDSYGCGPQDVETMLTYEAVRWAVQRINNNNYIPGVRLGMRAYDTCHQQARAMQAVMDFYPQYSASSMYCNRTGKLNLGFIGPISSWTTKPAAEMASQLPASMISPTASSPDLSNKRTYPYFLRTGLSSAEQTEAMIALMNALGWKRILLAYADNDYGRDAVDEFIRQSQSKEVCVVTSVSLPPQGSVAEYHAKIRNLGRYDVTGAVFFGNHGDMKQLMAALQLNQTTANIQWMLSLVNMNDDVVSNRMRGTVFVQPQFTEVPEFFDYFVNINEKNPPPENPWYQDWFMSTFQCRLAGINYAPYNTYSACTDKTAAVKRAATNTQYAFVDSAIKAVYAYAKALKNAQQAMCIGTGVCQTLRQMSPVTFHNNYLKPVTFNFNEVGITSLLGQSVQFDVNGDLMMSAHNFWNYNNQPSGSFTYKKVGSYSSKTLSVDMNQLYMYDNARQNIINLPTSPCPSEGCRNCLHPTDGVYFTFTPGDIIIGGLFDIHAIGSEVLTCGAIKPSHALEAAAFQFATTTDGQGPLVQEYGQNFLQGVDLGSLIIDLCDSGETGRLLLNNILGNRHIVRDSSGNVIDPYKIKSVVGTLDSTEAISVAHNLGDYMMPQLEAAATSPLLSNRENFPYFSRVVPSDTEQLHAIVMLLNRFGWRYIQVIHSADSYGRSGAATLRDKAAEKSICIAATHEMSMDNYMEVVHNLNAKPNAKIVVGILDYDEYRLVLQEMRNQAFTSDDFRLIGTETWGQRQAIVSGLEDIADGAISMEIISPTMNNFRDWLRGVTMNVERMKMMPFLVEWYEYAFNCYIDAGNRGVYTQQCQLNQDITTAPNYEETTYTQFIISATYAVSRALHMALNDYCGAGYDGVCWQFRAAADVREKVLGYIRDAQFDLENNQMFKIKDGEGVSNFAIYTFRNGAYSQIGTFLTESRELNLNTNLNLGNFESKCSSVCGECVYLLQHAPFTLLEGQDLKLGINVAVHNPGPDGNPFQCGTMRLVNGFQFGIAAMLAFNMINSGMAPVHLNGVSVGGIWFDHCNSPARAYGLPSALYAGVLESSQYNYSPDLNAIRAWMTDNTLVTEEMKEFFMDLNLPVISPMATSNTFLNQDEYPTFLRTIPGDSTIATALAILAKSLGLQYVTLVYSANSFGRSGMEAFTQIAQQEGICIIKAFELGSDTNTSALISALVSQSTHVVVTYLGLEDMSRFIDGRAQNQDALDKLLIFSPEPYPSLYLKKGASAKNILSLGMKARNLDNFKNFLMNLNYDRIKEHPGLVEYYQDLFECNLPGNYMYATDCAMPLTKITDHPSFFIDNYVLSTINAIYAFVAGAHETLKIQCGENYYGVCSKFYSDPQTNTILLQKMKEVNFVDPSGSRFNFIGQEGSTSRDIHLFNGVSMTRVGEFAGASVNFIDNNFQDLYKSTKSMCVVPCTACIVSSMNFTYIPGDILLGGIFDVHEANVNPFTCGEINTLHGFQLLEAFHFALQKVNDKSGIFKDILKNVRLGGVGLDACQSSVRGGYMVSNIHNGLTVLQRNGIDINPDDIDAYLGSYSSGRSVYLARLLKTLKIPQISFGSTSIDLLDRDRYPFFLRTVPADDHQAMAMVEFLRKYDIRYVQIVHQADNYGESGAKIFAQTAEANKICVAQTVAFTEKSVITQESANDVVLALLEKPIANTVIIFADSSFVNELLQAVRRNPEAHNKFKFIGSDAWANNKEATTGVEDIAVGSVTFDLDTVDLKAFDNYLSSKSPGNYPENPWFSEYYEEIFNCYLTIPNRRYPGRCPATSQDIATSTRYKQDTAIIHVINAVYASAIGIDMALKEICGDSYTTVCEAFKNLETRRELILEKMKEATFTDLAGHPFSFAENRGDSIRGYNIYSIDTEASLGYVYNPIGEVTSAGALSIQTNYKPSWDGSCDREDSCTECPTVRNLITRYMLDPNTGVNDPATLVALMNIHQQGVDEYRCGAFNMDAFMRALAVKFTIERLLPGGNRPFDLRSLVLDNCGNDLRIDQDLFNLLSTGNLCNTEFNSKNNLIDISSVIGVFTLGSRWVVAANRVTSPLKIQLLSSYATSTALSDKWNYPYFARTVPPDNFMMDMVAKILKENDWSYIGVIHSDESYGINGYRTLRDKVNEGQFSCIGYYLTVPASGSVEDYRALVKQVKDWDGVGVIAAIVVEPENLLKAAVAEGVADKFVWIGLDGWGNFQSVTDEGLAGNFSGAITVYFRDAIMNQFVNWIKDLKYGNPSNARNDELNRKYIPNDWFEEFYQHIHKCHLLDATVVLMQYEKECQKNENITDAQIKATGVGILDIAAVYAMATGLQDFVSHCNQGETIIECMKRLEDARERLFDLTLSRTWKIHEVLQGLDPSTEKFNLNFNEDRFWHPGYRIYNLKPNNEYVEIGQLEGNNFSFNKTTYKMLNPKDVVSRCPEDQFCECNYETGPQPQQQTKPKYMGAVEPRNYFVYDEDTGEQVYTWPIWAIAVAVCTCVGLLVLILLFFFFLIFYPVRGGTTVLGFIMMLGLMGVYAINFAFFLPASAATCGAREFCMGVIYSIVFAALFVKSVDNWRFKDREYSPEKYKGVSNPLSLVAITLGIVLVQCIIPIEWLIVKPPSASLMADATYRHDWMWCDPHDFYDISLVLSMIFVMFLVLMTAIFAALAWDSESNYYESRWIFVACVCTAGCFLVWMIVSTNAGPPYRDPAVALGNFFNATALLICIPIRKFVLLYMLKAEEEKAQMMPMPYDEADKEMYSTVYTNQTYEPDVFQAPASAGSKVSSEPGY